MKNLFPGFPDEARLWIFAFARPLATPERERVTRELSTFVPTWASHGAPVHGAYEIVEDRFLLVAGYVNGGVGGCSTDSMVRVLKGLREAGIDGFDRTLVFFRDADGQVRSLTRDDFQELVRAGQVAADTTVFDPTIQFVGDARRGGFETTFGRSWHAAAFSPSRPR
jgi:hypothetical protein